jgi:hypothetical protein
VAYLGLIGNQAEAGWDSRGHCSDDEINRSDGKVPAGAPLYMTPKQTRGEPKDLSTDLFSAGSLLYPLCE